MIMLHPSLNNSTGCLKITALCSKQQDSCITSYTVVLLATLDHACLLADAPSVPSSHPDCQYLTFPPFHSSLFKSVKNTLALVLLLMLLRFGMIFLMMYAVPHLLPPSGKSLKLICLQKPILHSLSVTPVSSWHDPAKLLDL